MPVLTKISSSSFSCPLIGRYAFPFPTIEITHRKRGAKEAFEIRKRTWDKQNINICLHAKRQMPLVASAQRVSLSLFVRFFLFMWYFLVFTAVTLLTHLSWLPRAASQGPPNMRLVNAFVYFAGSSSLNFLIFYDY